MSREPQESVAMQLGMLVFGLMLTGFGGKIFVTFGECSGCSVVLALLGGMIGVIGLVCAGAAV